MEALFKRKATLSSSLKSMDFESWSEGWDKSYDKSDEKDCR